MTRRVFGVLATALVAGVLVGGCGDDKKKDTTASAPPATATTPAPAAPAAPGTGSGGAASPGDAKAVAACKKGIRAMSLSPELKRQGLAACESAQQK